mmetsp:Transcript_126000/g.364551  ORF Transcript_126000/g.364551 Transcript_126000/m.364551 type:complete len:279 (+) Transcript_126000:783-1619(+)
MRRCRRAEGRGDARRAGEVVSGLRGGVAHPLERTRGDHGLPRRGRRGDDEAPTRGARPLVAIAQGRGDRHTADEGGRSYRSGCRKLGGCLDLGDPGRRQEDGSRPGRTRTPARRGRRGHLAACRGDVGAAPADFGDHRLEIRCRRQRHPAALRGQCGGRSPVHAGLGLRDEEEHRQLGDQQPTGNRQGIRQDSGGPSGSRDGLAEAIGGRNHKVRRGRRAAGGDGGGAPRGEGHRGIRERAPQRHQRRDHKRLGRHKRPDIGAGAQGRRARGAEHAQD